MKSYLAFPRSHHKASFLSVLKVTMKTALLSLRRTPLRTLKIFCEEVNLKYIIDNFHLCMIPLTLYKDIMPSFNNQIHVNDCNQIVLWSPLKDITIANFGHPVSKSWLRPWLTANLCHAYGEKMRSTYMKSYLSFSRSHHKASSLSVLKGILKASLLFSTQGQTVALPSGPTG